MRRFTDFLTGTLAGMLIGVAMCAAIVPDAWSVAPTPRPSQHADLEQRLEEDDGRTVSPVPSPDVAARTGLPERVTRTAPASPSPLATAMPPPSPTGTRPAATATPRTSHPLRGTATWFRSPQSVSAAGPRLRAAIGPGWRGTRVTVCAAGRCVRTVLGDWMRADKLIDLDDGVFVRVCGRLSLGVCRATVRW